MKERRRVAILTSYFYQETKEVQGQDRVIWGGAERYLVDLCQFLQSEGHDVAVYQPLNQYITDEQGGKVRTTCPQVVKDYKGIPIICLPDTDNSWQYSTNPKLNMVFNEIAVHFDLKIFFATFLCHPYVPRGSISISHGIFWDYHGHGLNTWTESGKKEFFTRQLYGFTAPDMCVAVDTNVRKVIAAISPGSENRIHVINNYVDTEKFCPSPRKEDGKVNVLYPRRLTALRGCNEFIRATRDYPQYNYLAVGQSGDEVMEKRVALWGETTPNLRFIHREMDNMPEIYQQADIAVVPTKASEGLSLSCLESFACGLPVITTPVGGLGDAVIPDYNALVYDPNHESLGEYIHFLAENPELCKTFGERNLGIAKCFDIKVWQQRWKRLIDSF